jgi:predicted AAA+ superfamily ATPase
MIYRIVEKNITKLAGKYPVISITGPRQSGKTTLSKMCFPEYDYVNLEMPDSRSFAQSDPKHFLGRFRKGVIIDEIQYVPELFSYMQGIVDDHPKNGQFIITGSQNFLLMEKISQSLAGRVAIINLLPFSIDELKSVKLLPKNWEEYIFNGSYPGIYDKKIQPPDFYPFYIQTYLERDVRNIANIMNLRVFKTFLEIAAGRIGQVINFTSISNELGMDQKTVKNWFSILEASFIVFFIRPFTRNYNKRLIKSPRMYFFDTGLVCSLLGINRSEDVSRHFLRGALFENLIFTELMKTYFNKVRQPQLYFWRDNTGNEIDCILQMGDTEKVIEIKSGTTITPDFFKGLEYYQRLSGLPKDNFYLVYGGISGERRSVAKVLGWHELYELTGNSI